jgi:hypothetical protein
MTKKVKSEEKKTMPLLNTNLSQKKRQRMAANVKALTNNTTTKGNIYLSKSKSAPMQQTCKQNYFQSQSLFLLLTYLKRPHHYIGQKTTSNNKLNARFSMTPMISHQPYVSLYQPSFVDVGLFNSGTGFEV